MKITTSGILSFDDCEKVLRPDMWKKYFRFLPINEKGNYCVLLLSEIPLTVGAYVINDFKLTPMVTRWDPFKPYGLLLHIPNGFDFLTAPLFGEALAPILSFSLRRRVKTHRRAYQIDNVPKEIPEDAWTKLSSISVGPEMSLQQPLTKNEQIRRLETFGKIFDKLMGMSEKDYLGTIRAFRLYQLSLLNYREDIGLAYTLLVAAIETVAECFVKIKACFEELPEATEWKEIFDSKAKIIEQTSEPLLKKYGMTKENIRSMRKRIGLDLDDFDAWVELTKKAKSLMENGIIDFDIIKEETLFGLLIMETMTVEQLAGIWEPDTETKE